jgi:hypothetical protein
MADPKKDKQMDEMLDSLLAQYSGVEPRPGLEQRILANLSNTARNETMLSWWNFKWLWAGAAFAAVIIFAAVLITGHRHPAAPTPTVVQIQQPAPPQPEVQRSLAKTASTIPANHRKMPVQRRPRNAALASSQRPALFPTPTPLSEQERLMFTYLANTPQEVVVAQMQRNDQKEADAFWADHEPLSGTPRSRPTR